MKPTFLIIGAQKGGTTPGIWYLSQHPDIYMHQGEAHFFDNDENYKKGVEWYEDEFFNGNKHFIRNKKHRGEKTPMYCFMRKSIDRIKKAYPNIKLLLFLRNPISRAYSQYNHIQQVGSKDRIAKLKGLPLKDIIERDLKKKNYRQYDTILQRGYYLEQIEYILSKFPRKNLKIIIGERYKQDPLKVNNEIFKFLGLKPMQSVKIRTDVHARSYEKKISKSEYDILDKLYTSHNEALYKFLGHRIEEWNTTYNNMVGVQKEGNILKKQLIHKGGNMNNLNITLNPSYNEYIKSSKKKNLIIICAGDDSLHKKKKWFAKSRKYVLCVNYFGDKNNTKKSFREECDIYIESQGPKWVIIRNILMKTKFWRNFDFVALPDDDLDVTVGKWNKLFQYGHKYKLNLYQPSLVDNGNEYVVHKYLTQHKECDFRYTDFVEIMTPIFSKSALRKSYKLLTDPMIKSGWGVDYIIPRNILKNKGVAIIDSVPIIHTKPLGHVDAAKKSSFYKKYNIDPEKEMRYFLKKYRGKTYQQRTLKCV